MCACPPSDSVPQGLGGCLVTSKTRKHFPAIQFYGLPIQTMDARATGDQYPPKMGDLDFLDLLLRVVRVPSDSVSK